MTRASKMRRMARLLCLTQLKALIATTTRGGLTLITRKNTSQRVYETVSLHPQSVCSRAQMVRSKASHHAQLTSPAAQTMKWDDCLIPTYLYTRK